MVTKTYLPSNLCDSSDGSDSSDSSDSCDSSYSSDSSDSSDRSETNKPFSPKNLFITKKNVQFFFHQKKGTK